MAITITIKNCADCNKASSGYCSKHCPNKKEHSWLAGQRCDTCDTYFRGDSMG